MRAARVAKGWTQTQLAGEDISVGYVSRIESGQRRPNSQTLEDLAVRLGVPTEHLLRGVTAREYDEIKLTLDFAELSLETGQHIEAESQARDAVERATVGSQDELAFRGHFIIARALEGQGNIDDAILELEPLVYSRQSGAAAHQVRDRAVPVLPRVRRPQQGHRGRRARHRAARRARRWTAPTRASRWPSPWPPPTSTAATPAKPYASAARRSPRPRSLDSPTARASAYWNASIFESERGSVEQRRAMAERALALLAEGQDSRNLARLRTQVGVMQLELDPPDLVEAHLYLDQAAEDLPWCSASPVEIAQNELARSRIFMLEGDLDTAEAMCRATFEIANAEVPAFAANARAVLGQIFSARGDNEGAKKLYRQAVFFLTGAGADRDAAQLWFELADLLEEVGDLDAARDAYRSAAATTGLRTRTRTRISVPTS